MSDKRPTPPAVRIREDILCYVVDIGPVQLQFPFEQIERMSRWCQGGRVDFIMVDDMIERRVVEQLEFEGVMYSKTDLRDLVERAGVRKDRNIALGDTPWGGGREL